MAPPQRCIAVWEASKSSYQVKVLSCHRSGGSIGIALQQRNAVLQHAGALAVQHRHQPELTLRPMGLGVNPALVKGFLAEAKGSFISSKSLGLSPPHMATELIEEEHQR